MSDGFGEQVAGVAALNDPLRRALYELVAASDDAVSREQAATAVGIQKPLAAFHLDKLVEEGLLDVEFRRLTGRTGPGAGRPAKLYRRSAREIAVSLPPREYDLAASLLAAAIEAAGRTGRPVRKELERTATAAGRSIGERARAEAGPRSSKATRREVLLDVLRQHGFEPRDTGRDVVLANCPFHAIARRHTDLVCGMNLHLLRGIRSAVDLGDDAMQPRLDPEPGRCCVKL